MYLDGLIHGGAYFGNFTVAQVLSRKICNIVPLCVQSNANCNGKYLYVFVLTVCHMYWGADDQL